MNSFGNSSIAKGDTRQVATDVIATYFGTKVNDKSLTPGDHARLGATRFEEWLGHAVPA
jgi:hypothetical protein